MSEYQAGMPDDDVRDVIRDVMAKQSLADRIEIHLSELLCAASANEDTLREPVAALVRMIDERIDERARAVVERAEADLPPIVSSPAFSGGAAGTRVTSPAVSSEEPGTMTPPSLSRTVGREVGAGVGGNSEPPPGYEVGDWVWYKPSLDDPAEFDAVVASKPRRLGTEWVVALAAANVVALRRREKLEPVVAAPQRGTATGALSKHCNDGRQGCYQRTRGECSCGCGRCLNERATPVIDHITMSGQMSEQDDEATQIARTCCADIHQDRCADIRRRALEEAIAIADEEAKATRDAMNTRWVSADGVADKLRALLTKDADDAR